MYLLYLLKVILFYLPAGLANIVPPFAALFFPTLKYPLDFNKKFRNQRIFGEHKTIRGFFVGILLSGLLFLLQKYLFEATSQYQKISLVDYSKVSPLLGLALGFGALGGDAIKSFFKRQIRIKPASLAPCTLF